MHALLIEKFGITEIHSEYGMTELLSQAYSLGAGKFRCPPWMRVEIADIHLPSRRLGIGHVGRIHIVDLANIHSCSFIATDDLGRVGEDGTFEVLGRIDDSELRGCNALYE
jgi:acyl-coenzyme A synthetase/AMP-(fatty) acid ligase